MIIAFRRGTAALLLGLLAGCASDANLASELVRFNRAQEYAANEVMLLNILRSRDRLPKFYSRFDVLRGSGSASPGLSLSLPFGPDAAGIYSASPSLSLSSGVSHDVKPMEDQDFYRGVLTPVSTATWALYQDQNWPADLLFHIFVEQIDVNPAYIGAIREEAARRCSSAARHERCSALDQIQADLAALPACAAPARKYENDPMNACALLRFEELVHELLILNFRIAGDAQDKPLGPVLSAADMKDPRWAEWLKDEDVSLKQENGGYRFYLSSTSYKPVLDQTPALFAKARTPDENILSVGAPSEVANTKAVISVATRSPDGMIYYLGEAARALPDTLVLIRHRSHAPTPLLRIGPPTGNDAITVEYNGQTYAIPQGDDHISMQVFALIQQVFALYNKASTAPSTSAVTIVN